MSSTLLSTAVIDESGVIAFFEQSTGEWRSERRYYMLPGGNTQEAISLVTVRFLPQGSPELLHLAKLHNLTDGSVLICGSSVTWDSKDAHTGRPMTAGETVFGMAGNLLYRDRGFSTLQPVCATCQFPTPTTMQLRTEYHNCVFEEEIKFVGSKYRTRQTIVTRSGEQQLVGQYLETRLNSTP